MAKNVSAINRTARRSAVSLAPRVRRQAITRALDTSTTLSSPKPTSAMDPASRPLPMATMASTLFQPIVRPVSAQAQRRKCGVLPVNRMGAGQLQPSEQQADVVMRKEYSEPPDRNERSAPVPL